MLQSRGKDMNADVQLYKNSLPWLGISGNILDRSTGVPTTMYCSVTFISFVR